MGMRDAGEVLGRRGLLAGAAALAAGALARLAGLGKAEAGHTAPNANAGIDTLALHIGQVNDPADGGGTSTRLFGAVNGIMLHLINTNGAHSAIQAATGATSTGDGGPGIVGSGGETSAVGRAAGPGILGLGGIPRGAASVYGAGVVGFGGGEEGPGPGIGVLGRSGGSVGVFGISSPFGEGSAPPGKFGLVGLTDTGTGVRGDSSSGNGVFGVSTNASGVYGFSNYSFGAAGVSNVGVGVYASSGSNWGLHASSPIFAGVFSGSVYVNGNFTVANGAKSAAVRNKRGEHRRVYCQESPEAWFEDFGRGELRDGRSVITLDPDFDAVVKGDDYMVFPVPEGDCRGLYVSRQGPHRFEVRELQGGTSSLPFSYRVVARRLDDVGRRLEKVDVPDFSKVKPLPPMPELPKVPDRPGR